MKICGYNEGLCERLNSDKDTGIVGDAPDLKRRRAIFGKHTIPLPAIQTFYKLLARQFEETNIIFLIWAATLYLIFAFFSPLGTAYMESLVIYTGLLFVALISAACDYQKEQQYLKLKDEINNQTVTVYRGAFGTC